MSYLEDQKLSINKQFDSELANRANLLEQAKQKQIKAYNDKYNTQAKEYKNQMTDVDTQSAYTDRKNKELLASIGAYNSGDNITMAAKNNMERSNSLNSILSAQNDYRKMIDDQISQASANYYSQLENARNEINAKRWSEIRAVEEAERAREFQRQLQQEQIAAQQRAAAASRAAAQQEEAEDPQQVLAALRMEAMKNPLAAGKKYATYYANNPAMSYVVKEAQDYANNWRYYAKRWGLSSGENKKA